MPIQNNVKGSILFLCDDNPQHANTVLDHINALKHLSCHKVYIYNPRGVWWNTQIDLNEFNVVVIHYSLSIINEKYISTDLSKKIHLFRGPVIQYIQDDYRKVNEYIEMMRFLGIDVLFTPFASRKIPQIYSPNRLPGVAVYSALTGYVPDRYLNLKPTPLATRPIDVGYRGREIPFWLGSLGQEKAWIGQGFLKHAARNRLKLDIAWREEDRIYGKKWDSFIGSCKAMLGTESGASITDFDGSVEKQTKDYLQANPTADFWEVSEQILKHYEGNLVENTISPRIFEYAAHRTAMILFPGEYSGVVKPWVHYIPLEKDFSNIDKVIEKLFDIKFLQAMTDRAYDDIIASEKYSYRSMVNEFDKTVFQRIQLTPVLCPIKFRFGLAQIERSIELVISRVFRTGRWIIGALAAILPEPTRNFLRVRFKRSNNSL